MSDKINFYIYSDASYDKQTQIAILGYLFFKTGKEQIELTEIKETNNIRAELRGVLLALQTCLLTAKGLKVVLYTDCQTVSGLLERRQRLEHSAFISKSKKKPLANADLYKEFYKIYDLIQPEIVWVQGHTNKQKASLIEKNFSTLDKAVRQRLRQKLGDL
ncbi:hypothetical protein K2X05_12870 [bacterium]|nr:hypothetical protein [bacterium]